MRVFQWASVPIQTKIFLALFFPALLLSSLFASILVVERTHDLNTALNRQVVRIGQQFAATSEYAIVFSDQGVLDRLMRAAIESQDVKSVRVFSSDRKLLTELGNHSAFQLNQLQFANTATLFQNDQAVSALIPIFATSLNLDPTPGAKTGPVANTDAEEMVGWVQVEATKSAITLQKYQLITLLVISLVAFNTLFALLSARISSQFWIPLNKLNSTINKLVSGHFSVVKSLNLPNDYQPLQKGLVELSERLENYREEMLQSIEQATEDMRRNMDSMEEKSAQLHIANKEATESNRLKSQFLANISHEVRTPLNAILGYTQILQKDKLDNQQRQYINTIEQSTNSLLAIIGDILDFSKIEAGKLSLEQSDVNIRDLVDDVYQILSANLLSGKKSIDLVPEFADDVPEWVRGDAIRIRQILTNLIGNAIKFTQQGFVRTKVTVVNQSNNQLLLLFQVIDSGIGIPANKQSSLFKPFSQVDTTRSRQFGGTGLGLVITKKLVEQMGGKIEVHSESGGGSNFRFTLTLSPSSKKESEYSPIQKSVLLFEPADSYRRYLDMYLSEMGVTIYHCSSPEHVVSRLTEEALQETPVEAVLLSVGHDDQSITDIHELAVYIVDNRNIPCILMTQPPSRIGHFPELQQIASDILLKPISHRRLYQSLIELDNMPLDVSPTKVTSNPFKGLKVLAVDDNQINLQLVSHWLKPNGLEVTLAYSGHQAIEMVARERFDLILMDIQMPDMDGMETTQILRNQNNGATTPIIALTAHALSSEKQQILESGMNAYLTKPVDEAKLLSVIDTWCLQPIEPQEEINIATDTFDLDKALHISGGQTDIAKDMFSMLAESLESERKLLLHHFESEETAKLIHVVHRIHGASKYCGTPTLTKQAGYLETHLKELGLEGVEEVLDDFIQAIDDLLEARHKVQWPE